MNGAKNLTDDYRNYTGSTLKNASCCIICLVSTFILYELYFRVKFVGSLIHYTSHNILRGIVTSLLTNFFSVLFFSVRPASATDEMQPGRQNGGKCRRLPQVRHVRPRQMGDAILFRRFDMGWKDQQLQLGSMSRTDYNYRYATNTDITTLEVTEAMNSY